MRRPKLGATMSKSVAIAAIASHFEHIKNYAVALDNAGRDGSAMVASQVGALISKIRNVDVMGCDDATLFLELVGSMPFHADDIQRIQQAVDDRVLAGTLLSKGCDQQHCDTFQHWLLESDWKRLDKCSVTMACDVMGTSANRVGIRNASERLLGRMAAMVAVFALKNSNPGEALLHNLKTDIQKSIKVAAAHRPTDLPFIRNYPLRPHMLSADFVRRAFPDEMPVDAQEYATLTIDHICTSKKFLRNTSCALRGAQPSMQESGTSSYRSAPSGAHSASHGMHTNVPSLEEIRPWKPRAEPPPALLALPAPEGSEVNPLDGLKQGLEAQEAELKKAKEAEAQAKKDKKAAAKVKGKAGKGPSKAEAKAKIKKKAGLIKAMAKIATGKKGCIDVMHVDLEEEEEEEEEGTESEEEADGAPVSKKPAAAAMKHPAASKITVAASKVIYKTPAAAMKRPAASKVNVVEAKAVILQFAKSKHAARNSTSRGAYTTKAYKNMLSLTKSTDDAKAAYKIASATWDAACA